MRPGLSQQPRRLGCDALRLEPGAALRVGLSQELQQRQETALAVQRDEIIAATNMGVANKYLRHSALSGDVHHVLALPGVGVDADFLYRLDPRALSSCLARTQ